MSEDNTATLPAFVFVWEVYIRIKKIENRTVDTISSIPGGFKSSADWCVSNTVSTVGAGFDDVAGTKFFKSWRRENIERNSRSMLSINEAVSARADAVVRGDLEAIADTAEDIAFGGITIVIARKVPFPKGRQVGGRLDDCPASTKLRTIDKDGDAYEIEVTTQSGTMTVIANITKQGTTLYVRRAHFDGAGKNTLGLSKIRDAARALGRKHGVDKVVVEGGIRTSGANPGKKPRTITIEVD